MSRAIRAASPNILIAVDGVCSFGAEEFLFDAWGIDAAMTCSQKGIATPPGLALLLLSQRALVSGRCMVQLRVMMLDVLLTRTCHVT